MQNLYYISRIIYLRKCSTRMQRISIQFNGKGLLIYLCQSVECNNNEITNILRNTSHKNFINFFCSNMQNVNLTYWYLLSSGCICTKTFERRQQLKSVSIYWSEFVIRLDRAHLSASLFFADLNGLDSYPF